MLECISLIDMLLLLVDDLRISGKNNALDEVCGVIYLGELLLVLNAVPSFLDLVLRLHLYHLAPLSDQIESLRHHLTSLLLYL